MSHVASTWAWEMIRKRRISHGKALVLLRLADHADSTGSCFPGGGHVADYTNLSERRTYDAIRWLENEGMLSRSSQQSTTGRGRASDLIHLHINDFAAAADLPDVASGRSKTNATGGRKPAAGAGSERRHVDPLDQPDATSGEKPATNRTLSRNENGDQPDVGDTTNRTLRTDQPDVGDIPPISTVNRQEPVDELVVDRSHSSNPTKLPTRAEFVFNAWVDSTGRRPGSTKLNDRRRKLIERALTEHPLEDVVDAVRGWRHFPHNRGENDRGRPFNEIHVCLKAENFDLFRDRERSERAKGERKRGSLARDLEAA